MIVFTLNDGSKVSLDDMTEVEIVAPVDRIRGWFWEEAIASFANVYCNTEKHFITNEAVIRFTRRCIGDAEPILIKGDAYEQDAEG